MWDKLKELYECIKFKRMKKVVGKYINKLNDINFVHLK